MQTFLRIDEYTTFGRQWFCLFQGDFHTWQKDPLQPLFECQRIHTKGLFTGEFTAAWPGFVPFAVDSQGSLYLEQYVGNAILYIVHCLDYTFLLSQFNNTQRAEPLLDMKLRLKMPF